MSNNQTIDLELHVEIFKALANPQRLRIFLRLLECCPPGEVNTVDNGARPGVGELGCDLDVVPSTVSHHIKELRRAGLIRCERRGQRIECSIDAATLGSLAGFFAAWAPPQVPLAESNLGSVSEPVEGVV